MSQSSYVNAVRIVLDHLEHTQAPAIERAADLVVGALTNSGAVFCAEIGHSLQGDFFQRAGGLAAVQPFAYKINIDSPLPERMRDRPRVEPGDLDVETIRLALRNSNLRVGDVLLVSSVSGRSKTTVELAMSARALGIGVIGFASLDYCAKVNSAHPSGKKLPDVVDILVDIGAPYGDADVYIDGYDHPVLPVSGPGMVCAGWMIWEQVMRRMELLGSPATVYASVNRPGGMDDYLKARKQYQERGY